MSPLFLLLLAVGPTCSPLPGDGELCLIATGNTPWVEVGLGFEASPDAPGKRGLGVVVAAALTSQLRVVAPGLELRADPHGLRLSVGARAAEIEELLERVFTALANRRIGGSETEAAVAEATNARRAIADDDRALGRLEVRRGLYGEAPGVEALGQPRELASITADDLAGFLKQHVCSGALHLVLAGSVGALEVQRIAALAGTLAACAPSSKVIAPKGGPKSGLDLLIVDKPERSRATIMIGAEIEGTFARPALEAALSAFGRDLGSRVGSPLVEARIDAPPEHSGWLLEIESSEPERALKTILEAKEPTLGASDRNAARRHAALQANLGIRDARSMARSVLDARLEGRAPTSPWELGAGIIQVSDEDLSKALKSLYGKKRFVVVVTSADAPRVQALGRLPGIRGASVVGYDTR